MKKGKILFLVLLPIISFGQIEPDPNQTFRNTPIVPYQNTPSGQDAVIQEYNIGDFIDRRNASLDFYNMMVDISEPSTLSIFSNYTFNINDYQKKPLLLDANVQIPIALGGKKWNHKGRMMHTFHVIPQFKVRNFVDDDNAPGDPYGKIEGDDSLPVRTPSYMPRLTWYFTWRNLFTPSASTDIRHPPARRTFFGLSAFHHSNGQDGPSFYDDSTTTVYNANYGDINVYNGNFGENLVLEAIYGGVVEFRTDGRNPTRPDQNTDELDNGRSLSVPTDVIVQNYPYNRRWYWRAALELHFPNFTTKKFAQYDLYGRYRLNLQSGYSWIPAYRDLVLGERNGEQYWVQTTPFQPKEAWRLVGNLQYILDPVYNDGNLIARDRVAYLDLRRLNIYASLFWRMTGSPNSALFIQAGYWGSDNYNIYFQEQIIQIKGGIAFAFFKYPKLGDFEREPLSR